MGELIPCGQRIRNFNDHSGLCRDRTPRILYTGQGSVPAIKCPTGSGNDPDQYQYGKDAAHGGSEGIVMLDQRC